MVGQESMMDEEVVMRYRRSFGRAFFLALASLFGLVLSLNAQHTVTTKFDKVEWRLDKRGNLTSIAFNPNTVVTLGQTPEQVGKMLGLALRPNEHSHAVVNGFHVYYFYFDENTRLLRSIWAHSGY